MHSTESPFPWHSELNEKCGVFGMISARTLPMGQYAYFALFALQHRGQESCGMAVFNNDQMTLHKDIGLVSQVFKDEFLSTLEGQVVVGHTRYSTAGDSSLENAQPVISRSRLGSIALAHNGNLIELDTLRERFNLEVGDGFGANSDSHIMVRCLGQALAETQGDLAEAAHLVFNHCEGAFSVVMAMGDCLIAARDKQGIRPLCLGQTKQGQWVAASETCALDIIGATYVRDLAPGEILIIDLKGNFQTRWIQGAVSAQSEHFCAFEYIYFARPDSMLQGQSVYETRLKLGQLLAQRFPADADFVIPVPDSGIPAAVGYARFSGIPYMDGLIKNRYVGRTFINPTQALREQGIRLKLNPLKSLLAGKNVVVIDDSIVRGNTSKRIVDMLKDAGVAKIHFRVSSPPVKHPCYYGIDMSNEAELIANQLNESELNTWLGTDTLGYLSEEDLRSAVAQSGHAEPCMACFNNVYYAGRPKALNLFSGCSS
jgi:amidophosphoribosyltransferase